MDPSVILGNGLTAALVGALAGAGASTGLQRRAATRDRRRVHRAAVAGVLQELGATEHVIKLMLGNGSVMTVPFSDVIYRSLSRELFMDLPEDTAGAVVRAYAHMGLLAEAVDAAAEMSRRVASQTSPPGALMDRDSHRIGLLAEDLGAALRNLSAYARDELRLSGGKDITSSEAEHDQA